jgi:hypothetical protein
MKLEAAHLLPGERIVLSKSANAVVTPTEYGLGRFPFDDYLGLVGMKGREAIGGKLHLTTTRLVFKSHALNRLKGSMSIFLPSIRDAADASRLATRKVRITTPSQQHEFVMWGIGGFLAALEAQRTAFGRDARQELLTTLPEHPEALGEGLEIRRSVALLFQAAGLLREALDSGPTDGGTVSTLVNLADLLYAE